MLKSLKQKGCMPAPSLPYGIAGIQRASMLAHAYSPAVKIFRRGGLVCPVRIDMKVEERAFMPTDLQNRGQYLALAEFCQPVIGSLNQYLKGAGGLENKVLEDVYSALLSVKSGDAYRFGRPSVAGLANYEQVRTLEEAWKGQLDEVLDLTRSLAEGTEPPSEDKAKARRLAELFLKLQRKALWKFEQPGHAAPPDVVELCRALNAT
jgi:hypothetical protein